MYTAFALVKFIDSEDSDLRFRNFRIRRLSSIGDREYGQAQFPGVRIYGTEWLYERSYQDSEVSRGAYGFGRIPSDLEDTLLLLRLFRPGDVIFTRHSIREPDGRLSVQFPQRITADITTSSFYRFNQADCDSWQNFASKLTGRESWRSQWFTTGRRFFLYGGAKEFNPEWNEADRVVDYMVALEASLVPERGFGIGQRLRKRAISLLGLSGEAARDTSRTLSDFYGVRSTLVHGSPLSEEQNNSLKQMGKFEVLVRRILSTALQQLPPEEDSRKQRLAGWYDVPDAALVEEMLRLSKGISSPHEKQRLLRLLGSGGDK